MSGIDAMLDAAVTEHVNELRSENDNLRTELAEARKSIAERDADIQALREALEKYGVHQDRCKSAYFYPGKGFGECDCGLAAALSSPHPGAELLSIRDAAKAVARYWTKSDFPLTVSVDFTELLKRLDAAIGSEGEAGGKSNEHRGSNEPV